MIWTDPANGDMMLSAKIFIWIKYLVGDSAKAVFLENEESRYILFTYMAIESH